MQMGLLLLPFLFGVYHGVRLGSLRVGPALFLAFIFAFLTFIVQVEDSREHLAFLAWSTGGTLGRGFAWNPHAAPFAVILWQFGFQFIIATWPRWSKPVHKESNT
jgi:hypothetical protein